MATQKIALEIDVNSDDGAKSLKELKQEFKELNSQISGLKEGSEEYYATLKKIADTKDSIDDLNESIAAHTGAGKFQALANVGSQIAAGFSLAQGAMALFGNESKEVEQALLKVQAAQAILAGFKELEGMADAFKNAKAAITSLAEGVVNYIKGLEGATAAQKLFNFIASLNPVGIIIAAVAALGAGLVILTKNIKTASEETIAFRKSMQDANEELGYQIKNNELLIKTLDGVYGKEKELAALREKNTNLSLEQAKNSRKAIIKELSEAEAELIAYRKTVGDNFFTNANPVVKKFETRIVELKRELLKNVDEVNELNAKIVNEDLKRKGEAQKAAEDAQKKQDELNKKAYEENKIKKEKERQQELLDSTMHYQEVTQLAVENTQELADKTFDINKLMLEKQAEIDAYYAQKKRERDERNKAFAISATQEGLQVVHDITNAFAGKTEEAQRRAFNINKAASIAEATISSILSAQKAFTSQLVAGDPTSPIRATIAAALAAAAGVARIAAIARTQFEGGAIGGSTGNLSGGFSGGNGATFTPNLNNSLGNTSTVLSNLNNQNSGGQQPPTKVYVTETDISGAIEKMNKIKQKALIE